MQHIQSLLLARPERPTCLTIGGFDGVHRGHQRVLRHLKETASQKGYRTAALTFFPLPRQVLAPPQPHYYLTSPGERARLLHEYGIDLVITHPFDQQVRAMRAADFVDLLVAQLDLREIWVGPDFALGYQREGNVPFLQEQGAKKSFQVHTVDFYRADDQVVSSSMIRQLIWEGQVAQAGILLDRPYRLPGTVVVGDKRGRLLGFPTANLQVWDEQALPVQGVFAGWARAMGQSYPAAINIGRRPTVTAGEQRTIEAHLLDFSGDLYGQEIALDFVARIRDEIKFNSPAALIAQLEHDVAAARRILAV